MKKVFSILLALTLIFSSYSMSLATIEFDYMENKDSIAFDDRAQDFDDADEVRIIVELEEEPIIEHATSKNKKVSELDDSTIKSMTSAIEEEQTTVTKAATSKDMDIEVHESFSNIINGFSCTTSFEEAKEIEKLPGVKRVYLANVYNKPEPKMQKSLDSINTRLVWDNLGYNGEGKVISIIDSGIDPSHRDMILTNPDNIKLDQDFVESLDLPGTYRTAKVPYGYNYYDKDLEILDLGPGATRHGMHVAGTAAANGDEENGGIKGVAPEAQLLAMKVFSNGPVSTTTSDIYIKAIDDSILMGADVINMSLGSTAGFVKPDDPEQQAIKRAVDNGLVVSISGGNSDKFGSGFNQPLAKNPDIGVVGSPGTTFESFQVASSDNIVYLYKHGIEVPGIENAIDGYGLDDWTDRLSSTKDLELVPIGGSKLGALEDYEGIDVTDKVVLVKRGSHTFADKTTWAYQKGAKAIIVYDHGLSTFYKNQGGWEIPFAMISKEDGEAIEALLVDGSKNINVNLLEESLSPTSGQLSDFSSWGLAPNLVFKPEITAPGGKIVSTDQDNKYQMMSGTSMAAPHVAGGSALMLQFVEEYFPELQGAEKVEMVKNLLMSTANPVKQSITDDISEYTSPRSQGAGLMDLYKATTTNAIVVDKLTNMSKVALNEVGDRIEFTVRVKNLSYRPLFYKVSGSVATDLVEDGYITGKPQPIVNNRDKTPIKFKFKYNFFDMFDSINQLTKENSTQFNFSELDKIMEETNMNKDMSKDDFTFGDMPKFDVDSFFDFDCLRNLVFVPMMGSVDVKVSIDLEDAKAQISDKTLDELFDNGAFVEGFIQFKDILGDEDKLDLSIPYCGFYGDWDKAPIFDGSKYDEESYYDQSGILAPYNGEFYYLGKKADGSYDTNVVGISPNGDNALDSALPLVSLFRNARNFEIDILDSNKEKILDLYDEECIPKSYCDGKMSRTYFYDNNLIWDGTVNGEVVPDGQYYIKIKAVIDYPDAKWNTKTFPVKIDTVAPVINSLDYDQEAATLTTNATDEGVSINEYILYSNGSVLKRNNTGQFDINELDSGEHNVRVLVLDYANNLGISEEITVTAK